MSDIVWEDPPSIEGAKGRGRWQRFTAELRLHPGKWAIVDTGISFSSLASAFEGLQRSGCEVARRSSDGVVTLYARWPEDA